jgi:integrase
MDDMADMQRLLKRGETYHYHRRVPLHLVETIGKKFIRRALGTDSLKEARRRRTLEDARTEAMFRSAEKGIKPTASRAGVSLGTLTGYVRETVAEMDRKASERLALAPPADKQKLADLVEDAEIKLGILTDPGDPRQDELVSRATDHIADAHGAELTDAALVAQFAEIVRRGLVEVTRRQIGRLTNENGRAFHDAAFDPAAPQPAPVNVATLDTDIVDGWAAERKPSQKAVDSCRSELRKFLAHRGPTAAGDITRADVLTYKASMIADGQTPANIKTRLSRLSTVLGWAAENGHLPTNPAKGITIKVPKKNKDKRQPFDVADLNAIFAGPVHANGERPLRGRGDASYWLPLLALFSGARLEEMAQLRPHDVAQQTYTDGDGQTRQSWFIKIVEVDGEDGTSVKTAGSERLVPVHPVLESLGFIAFVKAQLDAGYARLFHLLKPGGYGKLGNKWGEWWSGYMRGTLSITDKRKVFHSFRHTFKDMARHCGLPEGIARQIMGHSGEDAADDYGNGHALFQLVEGMAKVKPVGAKLPAPSAA